MALIPGQNTWATVADADNYLNHRVGADAYWGNLDNAEKEIPLVTAYNWLTECGQYTFPDAITPRMIMAQAEMALFLLQHGADLDIRMGLQAQGVTVAGIVRETYRGDPGVPVPPVVKAMLRDYDKARSFAIVDIERDEDHGVDYDAFGNLNI